MISDDVKFYADLVCDGFRTFGQVERTLVNSGYSLFEIRCMMERIRELVSERKKGHGKVD